MKTDARVKYTLMVIRKSLLELLKEKPINKITVKELCDLAEINRATFYLHYQDCYSALAGIEEDLLNDFSSALTPAEQFNFKGTVDNLFELIERYYELCSIVLFMQRDLDIVNRMIDIAHNKVLDSWKASLIKAEEHEVEMLFTSVATGMANIFIRGYEKYDHEKLGEFIVAFTENSVKPYI